MDQILILVLDASNFVLVIMLLAMGLVIIFGLMNVINMAHGELFLLGAYTLVLVERLGGGFWLGLLLAPLAVGLVGLLLEELVVRHVYHRFLDAILATWGLSIAIKQAVVIGFGPASQTVASPIDASVTILGAPYPAYRLFIMAVALAPIMSVDPQMGLGFLIPAFLSILVGGAGHLAGPLAGAAVIGGTDTLAANLWSPVVAQIVVFTMAIVVIRLFPRGIAAGRARE